MNHLLAKIKGKRTSSLTFKVFSNETVYGLPENIKQPKQYKSEYKLEPDECFHIKDFSKSDYCLEILKNDFNSTEYIQISKTNLKNIDYLISYQIFDEKSYYFFQKINKSQFITKTWFKTSDTPVLEKSESIVIINSLADAIYEKNTDTLYFYNLSAITSIFDGISELHTEATQEQTENFLNEDFISLSEDYDATKVGTANRKRIALALKSMLNFSATDKSNIHSYISDYCKQLNYDTHAKKFTINNEADLKLLIWGIEQRFYTTPISHEKRIANSILNFDDY